VHYECLIVDDEPEIAAGLCEYFNLFDVPSHYVLSADAALEFFEGNTASLLLLDVNLGDESGFALCKTLRQTLDIPILFVSARSSHDDMLMGFTLGGDDYITKPYSLSVMLAKVKATLKRHQTALPTAGAGDRVRIDATTSRLLLDDTPLELTNMEDRLLRFLLDNKGRVIDKVDLYQQVWGHRMVSASTLNVHIRRLREKIEADPNEPQLIKTVWGIGYVYDEAPAA